MPAIIQSYSQAAVEPSGTYAVPPPAGYVAGNLLILILSDSSIHGSDQRPQDDVNWTEHVRILETGGDQYVGMSIWWTIATGADDFTILNGPSNQVAFCLRVDGHDPNDPMVVETNQGYGFSESTHQVGGIDMPITGLAIVAFVAGTFNGTPWTLDNGYTPEGEAMIEDDFTPGAGVSTVFSSKPMSIPGNTGNTVGTHSGPSNAKWGCLAVGVNSLPTHLFLSDYVEGQTDGTWFPTINNASQVDYASDNAGRWTRTGKRVIVDGYFSVTGLNGTSTIDVIFGGLPFAIAGGGYAFAGQMLPVSGMEINAIDMQQSSGKSAQYQIQLWGVGGSDTYQMYSYYGTNDSIYPGVRWNSKFEHFSSQVKFYMQLSYITDDP